MPYKIAEIDLLEPLTPLALAPDETGLAVLARFGERIAGFDLRPMAPGTRLNTDDLASLMRDWFGEGLIAARLDEALTISPVEERLLPRLTVAICTHNRPQGLTRLLESLIEVGTTNTLHWLQNVGILLVIVTVMYIAAYADPFRYLFISYLLVAGRFAAGLLFLAGILFMNYPAGMRVLALDDLILSSIQAVLLYFMLRAGDPRAAAASTA